jgi:hypothetical protein
MWMKGRALFAAVLVISPGFAQTAREYYNELYAAGGLDRMVDEYVCFFEKPELKNFFLFGENKLLRGAHDRKRNVREAFERATSGNEKGHPDVPRLQQGCPVGQ